MRRTALVTGASRGIGRGIALALANAGFDIVGTATSAAPANTATGLYEVKAKVEACGARFLPVVGDISRIDEHPRMLDEALAFADRIDCFVSNAGIAPRVRADVLDLSPDSFDQVLGVNLRGAFFFAQAVARAMVAAGPHAPDACPPSLIFITSISARTASINRAEYCISKAGLSMAARAFAVRLAQHNINVYEIQPGIIDTDMTTGVRDKYDALIGEGLLLTPRWGRPEDIGAAVVPLATGSFAYATGAVIEVGGGFGVDRL
jgi:3-oxoacyl-[acyl-carrier protein] reductase